MKYNELRAYFFGNMYLSSIQQGIQAGHVIAEIAVKEVYDRESLFFQWAEFHKTMVLLNAGYGEEIHDLEKFFQNRQNTYPWAGFEESVAALDAAKTCVGIILPDTIYNASRLVREGVLDPTLIRTTGRIRYLDDEKEQEVDYEVSKWEFDMIMRLNNYGLAR